MKYKKAKKAKPPAWGATRKKLIRDAAVAGATGTAGAARVMAEARKVKQQVADHAADMATLLPLFTVGQPCVKCGCEDIDTDYLEEVPLYAQIAHRLTKQEHLERSCTRCHYRWAERTLDRAEDLELLAREAPSEQ
jgi:hypothetical protein